MDLHVGLPALRGRIERYRFDLLELPVSPTLARNKTLRTFRAAKPQLAFSLRMPPTWLEASALDEVLLVRAQSAADALGARFVVLPSGPRFRPTTANRKRLVEACTRLAGEGRSIGWEPRGLWEPEELTRWASEAGAHVVRDLTREPGSDSPIEYTRLLPFGSGARVTQHSLERLALALHGKEEAFVVVVGSGALGARSRLRQLLDMGAEFDDSEEDADEGLDPSDEESDDE